MKTRSPAGTSGLDLAELGRTLRAARHDRELSVEQLGRASQVSTGLISQLERGRGNPSFLTLRRLADALGVPLGTFLQGPSSAGGMVVRAAERKKLVLPSDHHLVYELLTPDLQRALEVLRTTIPPGWTNEEKPFSHRGEECVHVLTGTLHVTVALDDWELAEGDSITYDPEMPHWWANRSGEAAVIIGAVTPPSF